MEKGWNGPTNIPSFHIVSLLCPVQPNPLLLFLLHRACPLLNMRGEVNEGRNDRQRPPRAPCINQATPALISDKVT